MSVTDAIWLFRRRVVATSLTEGGSVAAQRFGVHRSTVYEWRRAALAYGEDGLRVRERRPPRMPNAYDFLTERRIVAVALAWPTRGCDFFAGVLGQQGHRLSRTGIQKCLRRKGLGHRAERLALLEAQQLLDHGLVTSRTQGLVDRAAKRIRADRPGELVCFDTLYVGELKEVGKVGKVWALIAIDAATSWTWVRIVNRVTRSALRASSMRSSAGSPRGERRWRSRSLTTARSTWPRSSSGRSRRVARGCDTAIRASPGRTARSSGSARPCSTSASGCSSAAAGTTACERSSVTSMRSSAGTTASARIKVTPIAGSPRPIECAN